MPKLQIVSTMLANAKATGPNVSPPVEIPVYYLTGSGLGITDTLTPNGGYMVAHLESGLRVLPRTGSYRTFDVAKRACQMLDVLSTGVVDWHKPSELLSDDPEAKRVAIEVEDNPIFQADVIHAGRRRRR